MVNRNIYLSILTFGIIFAVLTLAVEQSDDLAITILFLTLFTIVAIKWIEEWRYYKRYNAPLASAIFIVLPSIIGYFGSIFAFYAYLLDDQVLQTNFLAITFTLELLGVGDYLLFLNLFSVIFVIPPTLLTFILLKRYYSGRYPAVFIFRRRFPNTMVIFYNIILSIFYVIIWLDSNIIELTGFTFILLSSLLLINEYVMKIVFVPFRRVYQTRSRQRANTNDRSSRPYFSWELQRTPQRTRQSSSITPLRTRNSISVAPAVSVTRSSVSQKLTPAILSSLRPSGHHLTEDDFRCIFCYEFPIEHTRQVVICPHCRHPSHANEFQKWSAVADICSRCNKPISTNKMIRLSGKNYERIIKMFRKKQLK